MTCQHSKAEYDSYYLCTTCEEKEQEEIAALKRIAQAARTCVARYFDYPSCRNLDKAYQAWNKLETKCTD